MTMQQFCLRWNNHQPNFISVFSSLLNSETLVDVTLAAEGRHLQAHKVVLSACSSYFQSLFSINPCQHPIVILKDVKFIHLKVMVDFMYYGEVNVSQEQLPHILKTAEMLKIKGLAEMPDSTSLTKSQSGSGERAELLTPGDSNWSSDVQRRSLSPSPCPLSPTSKRKRLRKSSTGSGSGSTERVSDEQPNETLVTSPGGTTMSHVKVEQIKTDPGYSTEPSTPLRTKQHSTDSELQRESSQESVEDQPHQITLCKMSTKRKTITSPGASGKKHRKAIDLEMKMKIINDYEAGRKVIMLAREFELAPSTISTILRDKDRVKEAMKSSTGYEATITRYRKGLVHEMEKLLAVWFDDQIQKRMPMSTIIIQAQARSIFETLKMKEVEESTETFTASHGWFQRFRRRFNLPSWSNSNEATTTDVEVEENLVDDQFDEIYEEKYIIPQSPLPGPSTASDNPNDNSNDDAVDPLLLPL